MIEYWNIFVQGYSNYSSYLINEITNPTWNSYFYWLIGVSSFFFGLEFGNPWRKKQATFRKDFWLDFFYMFFNFFLFSLIIYNAASDVVVNLFNDGINWITGGFDLQKSNPMRSFPLWAILIIGFIVRDIVQWCIHRLLHYYEFLWQFHKVHHSVKEMGFAAHLRYHWMENIVYRSLEYIPLALLGIGLYDFFIIHIFTLVWGHYNHSNITVDKKIVGAIVGIFVGSLVAFNFVDFQIFVDSTLSIQLIAVATAGIIGYFGLGFIVPFLFNSPEMHIWHHSYELPKDRRTGVNFGLTLAIWDYIFGTAYIPHNGRDIELGFPGVEEFPEDFLGQNTVGFGKRE